MKSPLAQTLPAILDTSHISPLREAKDGKPALFIGIEMSGCAIASLKWEGGEGEIFFTQDDMDRLAANATDLQIDYISCDCDPFPLDIDASGEGVNGKAWLDFTPAACQLILDGFRSALATAQARTTHHRYISDTLSSREDWGQKPYTLTPRTKPAQA